MRIEFLSNHGAMGGGEVMLFQLAEAAVVGGHDVSVVGPRDSEVASHARTSGVTFLGVDGSDRRALSVQYARHSRRSNADLLWCNGPVPSVATAFARAPRLVHLHQLPTRTQAAMLRIPRHGALATLVPSRWMATAIPRSTTFLNWTTTPSGELLRSGPPRLAERGTSSSEPLRIGFIGRLSTLKGLDVLAEAVARLSTDLHVRLVVAGDDRFVPEESLSPVRSALGRVADRVDMIGWVDREAFHGAVDMVAVPSSWDEPFGLVAAEAMARRSPLLVTDAGALPEIVGSDHPWIARRSDPVDIAMKIRDMLLHPDQLSVSVEEGHRRWYELFSPTVGAERLASLLHDLA